MIKSENTRSVLFLIVLCFYLSGIFFVSHLPGKILNLLAFTFWDKLIHFGEYLPVGFLLAGWLYFRQLRPNSFFYIIAVATGIGIMLGIIDEIHQSFVPGRQSSIGDATADSLGTIWGSVIFIAILWFKNKKRLV